MDADPDFDGLAFQDLECDEKPAKQKLSKQEKKREKDAKYELSKPETKHRMNKKRKAKLQTELTQFSTPFEKREFLDSMRKVKEEQKARGQQAQLSRLRIVIDCSFAEIMGERENRSLAIQLAELYSINRSTRMTYPAQLNITNIYPTLQKYLNDQGYSSWAVRTTSEQFYELPDLLGCKFVYLTPDSEEEIQEIDEDTVYVVGGLVDRTIAKNETLNRARLLSEKIDITPKRLPISGMIRPGFKKALNVSTAALMIPEQLKTQNWEQTFVNVVPPKFSKIIHAEKQVKKKTDQSVQLVQVQPQSLIQEPLTDATESKTE